MILIPLTIINILGAIVLTSITGGIMMFLAMAVGIVLEKLGFIHIRFELLKGTAFFFLCPIAYILVKMFEIEVGYGFLFNPTPTISVICRNLLNAWCVGVIGILCYMLFDMYRLRKKYGDAFECDIGMLETFERVKEQLGLKDRRVTLCQSYHAQVPCITGVWHARIILSVEKYTEDSLHIILTHELTHYKQKDVLLKQLSFLVLALHFFNPLAWLLFSQVQKQSEFVCDYRACQYIGDRKKYFEVIMLAAVEDNLFSALSSQLFEKKHELVERVKKMNQVSKIKKRSKLSVAIVLAIAMLTSNLSVYAATMEGVEQYLGWYEATKVVNIVEPQPMIEYEEVVTYGTDEDVEVVVAEVEQVTRATSNIEWEISNNVKMCSAYFDCAEGGYVDILLRINPAEANISVGIESIDGENITITGSNRIVHTFDVPKTGRWRFFILNQSGSTVSVEGSYIHS